jgi:hypothetical protein
MVVQARRGYRVSSRLAHLTLSLALAAAALSACGGDIVSYVDTGSTYTTEQLQAVLEAVNAAGVATEPRDRAVELRHEALVQLRSLGGPASRAADLITRTFPASTTSVPVYVERATVNETDALVIVESWGRPDGPLSAKRLWALDAVSGEVLFSAATGSRR